MVTPLARSIVISRGRRKDVLLISVLREKRSRHPSQDQRQARRCHPSPVRRRSNRTPKASSSRGSATKRAAGWSAISSPADQQHDPLEEAEGEVEIVHDHHRQPVPSTFRQRLGHLQPMPDVQARCRLIGQEHRWIDHQHHGQQNPRPFAARQGRPASALQSAQLERSTHRFQSVWRTGVSPGRHRSPEVQPHRDPSAARNVAAGNRSFAPALLPTDRPMCACPAALGLLSAPLCL